ncbi:MAG: Crp/Fnr family transcriptional regulator [Propionibacteriaceae bacterium]|nr:Crp/Fnr family transcriptional regulator [Propionibacteriaceae bacterium]
MTSPPVLPPHDLCVARVPLFARLDRDAQHTVASFAHPAQLSRGQLLHGAGSDLAQLFVVHTGRLKVVRVTASGLERIVRIAEPGEVVGEHAFLMGQRPDSYVEALEDTSVCTFQHRDLARLMETHPEIGLQLLRTLSTRLDDAERGLSQNAIGVPARLADYLLELPMQRDPRGAVVTWPLPKRDVASYLGTTPESLSRALARLEAQGLLTAASRHRTILLDLDGLESLANG